MYRLMAALARRGDLKSLKTCVSAGEALPDPTRQAFKDATGIEIVDGIGSTEMMHIFISHTPEKTRRGATGYAIPGYKDTVLDEDGKPGNQPAEGTVRQLQEHVKKAIAPYKYPRQIEFIDTLPRTETGKVQRFKLRKQP